jgi:phosphatidylglycerol:prolipoprotein diacylglycerol transferase
VIPYVELPHLSLPFHQKIDLFGVVSTIGVVTGAALAIREAKKYAPGDDRPVNETIPWLVGCGLIGGHFMHIFAYHPEVLNGDPLVVLRVWEGLSSTGGMLGAMIGLFLSFRRMKEPILPHIDALALGTAPGWAIARIGCFLVHDHPGVPTDFFLAVNFPPSMGGPRHDLGLYDFFVLAIISAILWTWKRKRPKQGRLMGLLVVLYAPCRFFLDFLRASDLSFVDRRYAGLTPAQYVVVVLFGIGVWMLTRKSEDAVLKEVVVDNKGAGTYTPRRKQKGA